ncbi:hypothetical protein D3C73_1601990 [compost metagenome]
MVNSVPAIHWNHLGDILLPAFADDAVVEFIGTPPAYVKSDSLRCNKNWMSVIAIIAINRTKEPAAAYPKLLSWKPFR